MAPVALGRSAATAIAIDDSDAPEATVLVVSSDDEDDVDSSSVRSVSVLDVSAWGGSDATSRHKRNAPRPRVPSAVPVRPRSTAPSVVVLVGSDGPAASADGRDNDDAPSRRKKAKEPRPAPSFVSLRSPLPVVDSSAADPAPSGNSGTHEATSRQKRTQTSWAKQDELTILATMAENRRDNDGLLETGSPLLNKLRQDGNILRSGFDAAQLSCKVSRLKKKFIRAVAAGYGGSGNVGGGRNYRKVCRNHNNNLYKVSKEVWPELLPAAQEQAQR